MADIELVIKISEEVIVAITRMGLKRISDEMQKKVDKAIQHGTSLTSDTLADLLMEERIRGKLSSDTTFEKDVIEDVKCRLTVSIIDHRPCYCGSELREVWKESEVLDADNN